MLQKLAAFLWAIIDGTGILPVSMAEWSKACTVYDCSNIEITGSNPA
jgi:hypothetical protein